ncbi:hypothetical protein C8F04DRAFT_1142854 [Mycena alexandri]|uniref:Uncharacterized protein n=1 Tax=Mycena alexandri TaxID=1745969 RepID=A0AAD6S7X3_9AGAR|nr:hypothetical protein C8F04DRAFT_1142854 [Mycena alexandri]
MYSPLVVRLIYLLIFFPKLAFLSSLCALTSFTPSTRRRRGWERANESSGERGGMRREERCAGTHFKVRTPRTPPPSPAHSPLTHYTPTSRAVHATLR